MIRHRSLEPKFVADIPDHLEPGVLYVSMEYGTALHRCCCGCGQEVVTPLTPTDWKLTFDGVALSLWPSVGNWNLPCKSHYVIRDNVVIEAAAWSPQMIEAEKRRDKTAKTEYYDQLERQPLETSLAPTASKTAEDPSRSSGIVAKFIMWMFK